MTTEDPNDDGLIHNPVYRLEKKIIKENGFVSNRKKTIFVFDGLNLRSHLFDNFSTTCTCSSWFKMYSISNILYEA